MPFSQGSLFEKEKREKKPHREMAVENCSRQAGSHAPGNSPFYILHNWTKDSFIAGCWGGGGSARKFSTKAPSFPIFACFLFSFLFSSESVCDCCTSNKAPIRASIEYSQKRKGRMEKIEGEKVTRPRKEKLNMKKKFICWRLRGENGDGAGKTLLFFWRRRLRANCKQSYLRGLVVAFFPPLGGLWTDVACAAVRLDED